MNRCVSAVLALHLAGIGCRAPAGGDPVDGTVIKLWRHETDDAELQASIAAIGRFNASQDRWYIEFDTLPQGSYTESVTAAALANQLPCILDVDQPTVPNFAWTGHLRPLDDLLDQRVLRSINAGARGTYKGQIFSVGQFDVALALFGRRSRMDAHGVRIATMDRPYDADEMLTILERMDGDGFVIDINSSMAGEWMAYGYGPWLQSAGADLIDRSTYLEAEGTLNSTTAVTVVRWYQRLFELGLAERKPVDDQGFLQGRVDFHYTGSWVAKEYSERFGEDLVVMPPVDFGRGPRIGSGSWQWGISRTCRHPEGAARFIEFLLQPEEIAAISRATGFVPVSDESASLTEAYRDGGPWRLFYAFAKAYAVPRPATPGYPKVSSAFEKAMLDVRDGKPVIEALDTAVDSIEYDIERNRGYGFDRRGHDE